MDSRVNRLMDWRVVEALSLSFFLSLSLSIYLPTYLSTYLSIHPSIHPFIYLSRYLSTYLCIYPAIYLSDHLSIYLSVYLGADFIARATKNTASTSKSALIMRCFVHLNFDSHQNVVHFFDISTSTSGLRLSVFNRSALLQQLKLQKVLRAWFCTFWLPRSNGAQFVRISTFKNAPNPWVFHTFDIKTCFAPQRLALFQKCSEPDVFNLFWLRNVLRTTAACAFSTSQLVPLSILTDVGWQSFSLFKLL